MPEGSSNEETPWIVSEIKNPFTSTDSSSVSKSYPTNDYERVQKLQEELIDIQVKRNKPNLCLFYILFSHLAQISERN